MLRGYNVKSSHSLRMLAQVWDSWQRFIQPLVSKVGLHIYLCAGITSLS